MSRHRDDRLDGDRLAQLLELADGPRDLPPGEEDRILTSILATATAPRADDPAAAAVPDDEELLYVEEAPSRDRRTRPRLWSPPAGRVAAAVAFVAVAIVAVVVTRLPDARPPTIMGPDVAGPPASELQVDAICVAASDLIAELRFDTAVPDHDADDVVSLLRLAGLLEELERRISAGELDATPGDRLTAAVAVLRLEARQLDADDDAFERTWARAAALVVGDPPLLVAAGCDG